MVFHEITQDAIRKALKTAVTSMSSWYAPKTADFRQARSYTLSPVVEENCLGLSAGRVQSVAVRLLVNQRERRAFRG